MVRVHSETLNSTIGNLMYRLHIDIPMSCTENEAIELSHSVAILISLHLRQPQQINYRLGHDDDRQKSNYLVKNANGHVSNKKCVIILGLTSVDPIV